MLSVTLAGIVTALAVIVVLAKIGLRKCLYFDIPLDISVTIVLAMIFAGTFSGMFAAIVGGLVFSVTLTVLKKVIGYEKPTRDGWVMVPPKW